MMGGGAIPYNSFPVGFGGVPLVFCPLVFGVFFMEGFHEFIPVGLGQDGCRRNVEVFTISFYYTLVWNTAEGFEPVSVNGDKFRRSAHGLNGLVHAFYGCVQDVQGVDLLRAGMNNCITYGDLFYKGAQLVPLFFAQLLRVVQVFVLKPFGQDHRCCGYRSCQTTPACFVCTCFRKYVAVLSFHLFVICILYIGVQCKELLKIFRCS